MTQQDDKTLSRADALITAARAQFTHATMALLIEQADGVKRLGITARELRYAADLIDDIIVYLASEDPAVAEASEQDDVG